MTNIIVKQSPSLKKKAKDIPAETCFSLDISRRRDRYFSGVVSSSDIRLKMYEHHGGEKSVQIRILHAQ